MKTIHYLAATLLCAALCTSCDKNNGTPDETPRPVQFSAAIARTATQAAPDTRAEGITPSTPATRGTDGSRGTPRTRATNTSWDANDAIGIYMIEHDAPLSGETIMEGADNVKYTTAAGGTTGSFTSATPIYYPVNGPGTAELKNVAFRAYYPYSETAIDEGFWYELDLLDQSEQAAIDLMTASADNNGAGYDKHYETPVDLQFEHQLSKVIILVEGGDGVDDLTGLALKLKGADHIVLFDLADFSLVGTGTESSNTGGSTPPAIIPFAAGDNRFELILPPSEFYNLSDCIVEFTVGGNTYVWKMTNNTEGITMLDSGHKYTFTVTLKKSKVQATGTITPWVEKSASGTAD